MIYLRKPSDYWFICSTMVTELSCPFPAHIRFYFAVPYLTIICHNNKLHVLGCLQSLPLVLSKKHEKKKLFCFQPWYIKVLARGNTQCLRFPTKILLHTNLLCIPPPHGSFPYQTPQDLITESRRMEQSPSEPFSFLELKRLSYLSSQENIPSSKKTFAISKARLKEGWGNF